MERDVVIDTGPRVAALAKRDAWHTWAVARWREIEPPMETCEAVLTEAAFLLRNVPGGADALLALVEEGVVEVRFDLGDDVGAVRALLARYADQPMSVADACLVRLTEIRPRAKLLTLDQDFRRYRRLGRKVIPLIAPK
ncbi:MAG: type II toxin-antitoxin system VapC family toxin [Acidobacteria bacterium]|nr:type II toxin-antitoxin system VapC family toxin [Acidobacteriota bacterium]